MGKLIKTKFILKSVITVADRWPMYDVITLQSPINSNETVFQR